MLQIRLLGQFDIRADGKRITISSRAGQSLLAYLALTAGTAHRREKLAGILWPDFSDDNARKNLRHELWRARKALAGGHQLTDYLLADEFTITFNRSADYWLDAAQLERPDLDIQSLSSNLSLYQGELLPGFFEDWVVLERERIQTIFETKMEQLLNQLIAAERWIAVQEQGERWLALGNSPEPAYRALMLAHGARGDIAKVSSVYQRCMADLDEKLGLEPSAETRALYDGLLKGTHTPRSAVIQQSGTITFLFTDIEESTSLLDKLGDQYAAVLADHHKIMRNSIQKWNGREVDTQGDSFFITFTRSLDAIQCAAEAQRNLASHAWTHGSPLRVRMGLHTGEPLIASTGYVGMDVHRAARIGDAAHGGQVLLSHTTRELVINDTPKNLSIRDLGEFRLKDMKFPTPIYQLVVEGLSNEFPPPRTKFSGTEAPTPGEPPFKGLQYFDEMDSDLFFGRELLTAKLVRRLGESQFLSVIIGASGSGKSSVVRAGVIPAIKKGAALIDGTLPPADSATWRVHVLTPTAHPLEALATELTRESESVTATATLMDDLMQDPRSLGLFLARQRPRRHTLLILDQFEELFTLCRDEFEREAFIDNLLTAITVSADESSNRNVTLMITLRADFYAHLAQYPELRDAVAHQQEYIGPMTIEELRRAIEEPARGGHWEFEPGLVDLILRDVGDEPGALPLLSHALLETWKRRAGHTLTLKGYADAGGVRGAISHTAESMYQNLSSKEQIIARNIFIRLTEFGEGTEDTRRRASFDELLSQAADADEVRAVLNKLAEARLITLGEDSAEVAHEALIREWPQLREWLSQDREGNILHRRLTEAAQEWELLERDTGSLYRGARLAQANEWSALNPKALNAQEKLFLEASNRQLKQEEQEREAQLQRERDAAVELAETQRQSASRLRTRNRVITTVGSIAIILALLAGMFGVQSNNNAEAALNNAATAQYEGLARATQQTIAETNLTRADALRLAAEANKLLLQPGSDADLTALLSIRSINTEYTPQGDAALEGATTLAFPLRIFTGHTDGMNGSAISPDGKYLLTGSYDKTVRLWDVETGKEIRKFSGHTGEVARVAFSPDGEYAAAAVFGDKTVRLWNTQTGELLRTLTHPSGPRDVLFLPDGRHIITANWTPPALLWDIETGQVVREFAIAQRIDARIYGLALSHDGQYLLTGGKDGVAHLWEVQTGIELHQFLLPAAIISLAFSPDDLYIASAGFDNVIRLLDRNTGEVVRTFAGHIFQIWSLSFSPDGKHILSGSDDGTARLWNTQTGSHVRTLTTPGVGFAWGVVFSPDGRYIFTPSGNPGRLWETESVLNTGLPQFISPNDQVNDVAFSPDGKYVATANQDRKAKLWDVQTRKVIREFVGHTDYVLTLTFSPDGRYLLTGGGVTDNTARLWDVQTGQELRSFAGSVNDEGGNAFGENVAFLPDGEYIAVVGDNAVLWDVQNGKQIREFVGHTTNILDAYFSPDSEHLLTGSEDGTARVWVVQTGEKVQLFEHEGLWSAALSPDGRYVLTGGSDYLIRLWDIETGIELRQYLGHTASINSISFSHDGKYVLSTSDDGTARLWDFATGRELRRFTGHLGWVADGAFSLDDQYVLTGSVDGTARMWFVDYHDTLQYLCSHLTRDFTEEEREQYEIKDGEPTCPKP